MEFRTIVLTLLCLMSINAYAIIPGIKEHVKGDVIAVRTDDQISWWCDFDKQVVRGLFYLCIYNGKPGPSSA